jgi:hypothetical protein
VNWNWVMRVVAACTFTSLLISSAQAAHVDWKLYGGASVTGPSFCFYDAKSVAHTSSGYIRVWAKCLAQKDLEGVDVKSDLGAKIVDSGADKIAGGYAPPIIVVGKMEFQQIAEMTKAFDEIPLEQRLDPSAKKKPNSKFFIAKATAL